MILPASKYWVLEDSLPTGLVRPVDPRLDFRMGQAMEGLDLDDVLTGLELNDGHGRARLIDDEAGTEFRLTFDRAIRELVVFTPVNRPNTLAVEPYTQTTDAINLQPRGIDAGLRILSGGQSDNIHMTMETLSWS